MNPHSSSIVKDIYGREEISSTASVSMNSQQNIYCVLSMVSDDDGTKRRQIIISKTGARYDDKRLALTCKPLQT